MKFRAVMFLGLGLSLCACSDEDWDKAMTYNSVEHPTSVTQTGAAPVVETAAIPPPSQAATMPAEPAAQTYSPPPRPVYRQADGTPTTSEPAQPSYTVTQTVTTVTTVASSQRYCAQVGQSTVVDAAQDNLDAAVQQQAADAVYRQCMSFYGASAR